MNFVINVKTVVTVKMISHSDHQMQITSLLNYFPSYSEQEFNQKFRQETKRQIFKLLQERNNLTDREMADILGYKDPNKVRPRRNELTKKEIVVEDKKRTCLIGLKLSIAWKLNEEKLLAFMNS